MEPLSRQALDALKKFRDVRVSAAGTQEDAWAQISRRLHDEDAAAMAREQASRRRRRRGRLVWLAIRPTLVASMMAVFIAVAWWMYRVNSADALLGEARNLIAAGQYAPAYDLLAEHARKRPTRSAAEQRMGLVVDALCGLDERWVAREALARYLEVNPESEHMHRPRQLCPGEPHTSAASAVVLPPMPDLVPGGSEVGNAFGEEHDHEGGEVVTPLPTDAPWFSTMNPMSADGPPEVLEQPGPEPVESGG